MTYEQILIKITAICAKSEHCLFDVKQKMDRFKIDDDTQQHVLKYLVEEKFIDEKRYAKYFINDKMKYNKWGKKKIEQALWLKRIPRNVYQEYLDSIEDNDYEEILLPLLKTKMKSVKGKDEYEKRIKTIRYALQRGFSYEQVQHCFELLTNEET